MEDPMPYRILTLDGGGAWALIEVKALIAMYGEATLGHDVLRKFDMVGANSGGSIVLGGLVENVSLGQLLGYFNDRANRELIFSPTKSWGDEALRATLQVGPKYSAAAKLPAFETLLKRTGNLPLAGIAAAIPGASGDPVRLFIVGFDYDYNRATMFRSQTPQGPCLGVANSGTITLAEAIHASTNAPINYFDAPATFPEHTERYWDGGISGFNNPVLAAVTEAITIGVAPRAIAALSLGTGAVRLPPAAQGDPASAFTAPWAASSLLSDVKKLASSILDDPPDSASMIAHVVTSGPGMPAPAVSRVVRMNPLMAPVPAAGGGWQAPGGMTAAQFQYLCGIDMDAVQPAEIAAIESYAQLWLDDKAPNQPVHWDGKDPATVFGPTRFSAALAAWQALAG
jgi:hypothetical protein